MTHHAKLIEAMLRHESGCAQRAHHFLAVHGFAAAIAQLEGLDADTRFTLEAAAITHDIGIGPSLEKHGDATGPHQEAEGPIVARPMLTELGYADQVVDRVCLLIGHHHTWSPILGPDHQILLEADFLVNAASGYTVAAIQQLHDTRFVTRAGKQMLRTLYLTD